MKKITQVVAVLGMALLCLTGCEKKEKVKTAVKGSEGNPFVLGVSPMSGWYGWYGAQDTGIFKKNDVSVEIQFFPVYSDSLTAFYSGKLDGICIAGSDAIAPLNEGVDFKIVLVNDNSYGADGLVVHDGIKDIKDIKGKSVSTEVGTLEHMFLLKILKDNGMSMDDIQFSNMTINDAGPAFIAGSVDAAVLWEPTLSTAVNAGGKILYSTKETPGLIPDCLAVTGSLLKSNPEVVQKVCNSWFDLVGPLNARDEKIIQAVCKGAELSKEEYIAMLDGVTLFDRQMNQATFKDGNDYTSLSYTLAASAQFLYDTQMIKKLPEDVKTVLYDSFIK